MLCALFLTPFISMLCSSICYYELGRLGQQFLNSLDPKVVISFPRRDDKESSANKKPRARKASIGGAPKKKAKRASATAKKKTATKKASTSKKRKKSTVKAKSKAKKMPAAAKKKTAQIAASEIIELSSSDEEEGHEGAEDNSSDIEPAIAQSYRVKRPRVARQATASIAIQQDDDGLWSEDEEYEFD